MSFVTRFAPSPTGPLHLGHAYSAMLAHDMARQAGGTFLVRIEDIDRSRARADWEAQIFLDLAWLGLDWPRPVMRQSERQGAYDSALDRLWEMGVLYSCTCRRRDILTAASAPQEGGDPPAGPDGVIYPGTCRPDRPPAGPRPVRTALRLDIARAISATTADPLGFEETGAGPTGDTGRIEVDPATLIDSVGDAVVARRDMGSSYHLAVVVDDAEQRITDVVRGRDLFEATALQVLIQRCLDLPTPRYHHHRLVRDDAGRRLAKRDDARAIARYRNYGATPADMRRMLGLPLQTMG